MKKIVNKKLISYLINFALLLALFVVLEVLIQTGVINRYYGGILTMIGINIILAVSLNLATGFLGQLVLGHAGFMSVGAYTAALFTLHAGLPDGISLLLGLLIGGTMAALFGLIIGIPALRLKGDYLAIITLGFGEIIRVLMNSLSITGGAKGLSGIPAITTFPSVFFVAAISVYIIYAFINSRHGRAVIAIREDEIAAEASGINTTHYKMLAFVVAAFFAGIAGGLYAHHIGVLAPDKFDFNYSVEILVMVVLGGMGSITGSILAAVVLTALPELLRSFSDYRMLLYSIILIGVMLFKPTGLLGQYEYSFARMIRGIRERRGAKARQRFKEKGGREP